MLQITAGKDHSGFQQSSTIFGSFANLSKYHTNFTAHQLFSILPAKLHFFDIVKTVLVKGAVCIVLAYFHQGPWGKGEGGIGVA